MTILHITSSIQLEPISLKKHEDWKQTSGYSDLCVRLCFWVIFRWILFFHHFQVFVLHKANQLAYWLQFPDAQTDVRMLMIFWHPVNIAKKENKHIF